MSHSKLVILGLGSRTTAFYLSELNSAYQKQKGGYSTFPLLLLNADFNKINPFLPSPSLELDDVVQSYVSEIEEFGKENILIPNITLHETIDRINVEKNIIHPIHLTISTIKKNQWTKIVLFGSLHSMQSTYLNRHFKSTNIEVILPLKEEMLLIDEVRKQVYHETETEDLIKKYHSLILKYSTNNPVVLACTELSIFNPKNNNNIIDMVQLQIEEALNLS